MTGISLVVPAPALAGETGSTDKPSATISSLRPVTLRTVPTEEVRALAAGGGGELITLKAPSGDAAGGATAGGATTAGASLMDITCYLLVGTPYGGGAPTADVLVDGIVYCDGWVHLASLTVTLYRSDHEVATGSATYPYVYGISGTVGIPDCVAGSYFGGVFATLARYDHTPPVISGTRRGPDRTIACTA